MQITTLVVFKEIDRITETTGLDTAKPATVAPTALVTQPATNSLTGGANHTLVLRTAYLGPNAPV